MEKETDYGNIVEATYILIVPISDIRVCGWPISIPGKLHMFCLTMNETIKNHHRYYTCFILILIMIIISHTNYVHIRLFSLCLTWNCLFKDDVVIKLHRFNSCRHASVCTICSTSVYSSSVWRTEEKLFPR